MLFGKNRVEEDLEKIKTANLPYQSYQSYKPFKSKDDISKDELMLEKGDILAMIIAIMSLIVPYLIAFVGIMAGVVFLLGLLY